MQCSWLSCKKTKTAGEPCVMMEKRNFMSMWSAVCDVRIKHDGWEILKKTTKQNRAVKAFRTLVWKSSQYFFFFKNTNLISVSFGALIHLLKKQKKGVLCIDYKALHCFRMYSRRTAGNDNKNPQRLFPRSTQTQWEWSRRRPASSLVRILPTPLPSPPKGELQWINHLNSQG